MTWTLPKVLQTRLITLAKAVMVNETANDNGRHGVFDHGRYRNQRMCARNRRQLLAAH